MRSGYDISRIIIQNIPCLLMQPKEKANLTSLRRQVGQLKKLTGLDSVLCLENVSAYSKEKMLLEGIPFVVIGKQIYMPFLGVALSEKYDRALEEVEQISFITQKLLLVAIYEKWTQTTLSEAASILNVSKMSITRCFDEISSVGLDLIKNIGKTRCFVFDGDRYNLWSVVRPFLRSSVVREYRLGKMIEVGDMLLSGMSAVSHYSTLSDNSYQTYAVSKAKEKELELAKLAKIPDEETPVLVAQVLGYMLHYLDNSAIDPLSAILSLTDEDLSEPRVESALEEILEVYLID
jgi:hypothetical protein